jgi:hypothetical protein
MSGNDIQMVFNAIDKVVTNTTLHIGNIPYKADDVSGYIRIRTQLLRLQKIIKDKALVENIKIIFTDTNKQRIFVNWLNDIKSVVESEGGENASSTLSFIDRLINLFSKNSGQPAQTNPSMAPPKGKSIGRATISVVENSDTEEEKEETPEKIFTNYMKVIYGYYTDLPIIFNANPIDRLETLVAVAGDNRYRRNLQPFFDKIAYNYNKSDQAVKDNIKISIEEICYALTAYYQVKLDHEPGIVATSRYNLIPTSVLLIIRFFVETYNNIGITNDRYLNTFMFIDPATDSKENLMRRLDRENQKIQQSQQRYADEDGDEARRVKIAERLELDRLANQGDQLYVYGPTSLEKQRAALKASTPGGKLNKKSSRRKNKKSRKSKAKKNKKTRRQRRR